MHASIIAVCTGRAYSSMNMKSGDGMKTLGKLPNFLTDFIEAFLTSGFIVSIIRKAPKCLCIPGHSCRKFLRLLFSCQYVRYLLHEHMFGDLTEF